MIRDFVLENCNAPGTNSTVQLAGAPTGRRTFAQAFSNGANVYYYMDDGTQAEWGIGVLTTGNPSTLSRGTVLGNTAGNTARLNFAGVTRVYNEIPASACVYADQNGNASVPGVLTVRSSGSGAVALNPGSTSLPGYLAFFNPAGTRVGYIGWSDGGAFSGVNLMLESENGFTGWSVTGNLSVSGLLSGKGGVPVGAGIEFWGATPPPGWVWANGGVLSRTIYAALFAVLGTTYGAGDGSTTFNLPDKRGRLSLAPDNLGGASPAGRVTAGGSGVQSTTLGGVGGDEHAQGHSHGVNDPGHSHGVNDPGHSHTLPGNLVTETPGFAGGSSFGYQGSNTNAAATGISIQGSGTGVSVQSALTGAAQNMPPVIVCNYIIYAGV